MRAAALCLATALSVLAPLGVDALAGDTIGGFVESLDTGCPPYDDEFGGGEPAFMVSQDTPVPGGAQTLFVITQNVERPGALLVGMQGAELSRFGCPLVFAPLVSLPFATDLFGDAVMVGRWPQRMPPGMEVFVQAYVTDPESPTGFRTTNTLLFGFPTPF